MMTDREKLLVGFTFDALAAHLKSIHSGDFRSAGLERNAFVDSMNECGKLAEKREQWFANWGSHYD